MRYIRLGVLLACAALSTGCLRMTYTLNLKPDGSGTIVQSIGMSKAAMEQILGGLAAAFEVKDAAKPGGEMPFATEAELRAQAATMGAGVRFVGVKPLAGDLEGQVATFAFDDVTKLDLNLAAMMAAGLMGKAGVADAPPADAKVGVTFARDGGGAVLTLAMPKMEPTDAEKQRAADMRASAEQKSEKLPEVGAAMEQLMKEMLKGFYIEAAINVDGRITSTDAPYVDGSKVTLLQMDFEQLMKSMKDFQSLMEAGPPTGNLEAMLKIPGMKVVLQPQVRIAFR